jgi:N-acetylmuramoyl-L-alanine amidase
MKILIDNGHGLMTAGKRSPDGQFREAFYNREIARRVVSELLDRGYDAELLVPEDDDISLTERVRRTNKYCLLVGKKNVVLVSIHVNAAGDGGKWLTATGWSCYTCKGETASDKLAECMYESAAKNLSNMRIRTELSDGDRDWEKDFYILKHSWCPAVLSENFFMDNKSDIAFLNSRTGKDSIVITHVEGIIEWMESI